MKLLGIILVGVLIFIGCSEPENMPSQKAVLPDQLEFKPTAKGTALQPEEKEELRLSIGSRRQIVLPEEELVFSRNRFSTSEISVKEERLRRQDLTSYNLLKDVQSKCYTKRPSTTFEGSLPVSDQGVNFKVAKPDDKVSLISKGEISGEYCPLNLVLNYDISAQVHEFDSNKGTGVAGSRILQSGQAAILSPKYSRLIGTRGIVMSSTMKGLNIRQEDNGKILFDFKLEGSYLSLKENIPFKGVSQLLQKIEKDGKRSKEFSMKMSLDTKTLYVDVDVHFKEIDGKSVFKKYYLNGHVTSESEFNQIFGGQDPATNALRKLSKTF